MWVLNIFLYLIWAASQGNPQMKELYNAMKAAGAPCFAYVPSLEDPAFPAMSAPLVCFYDPSQRVYRAPKGPQ